MDLLLRGFFQFPELQRFYANLAGAKPPTEKVVGVSVSGMDVASVNN